MAVLRRGPATAGRGAQETAADQVEGAGFPAERGRRSGNLVPATEGHCPSNREGRDLVAPLTGDA